MAATTVACGGRCGRINCKYALSYACRGVVSSVLGWCRKHWPLLNMQASPEILTGQGHGENIHLLQSQLPRPLARPSLQTECPHLALRPQVASSSLKLATPGTSVGTARIALLNMKTGQRRHLPKQLLYTATRTRGIRAGGCTTSSMKRGILYGNALKSLVGYAKLLLPIIQQLMQITHYLRIPFLCRLM